MSIEMHVKVTSDYAQCDNFRAATDLDLNQS